MLWLLFVSWRLALAGAQATFPPSICSVEGQACGIAEDNLLAAVPGVEEQAECERLCTLNPDCEFITHFGADNFPLRNYCMLHRACSRLARCQNCTIGVELCFEKCGASLEGALEENVVDIIPGMEDEVDCKALCRNETSCEAYTYHDRSDPALPGLCFLLTALVEPVRPCRHCASGFPSCRNITAARCSFSVGSDATAHTAFRFTALGNTTVTISPVATLGGCELAVVAVGGGGAQSPRLPGSTPPWGGGGSGYWAGARAPVSASELVVRVGGGGEESTLGTGAGELLLRALPGGNGGYSEMNGHYGGAGYSGGGNGGSNTGYGGQDGTDGCCGANAGPGAGLRLDTVGLQEFTLSPGIGGEARHHANSFHYGGGGGGVLVDGTGPRAEVFDGHGYGGGMGALGGRPGPGVVLLEIRPKH